MSHYKTIGVSEDATIDEVKRAFRELAIQCHPDHHPGDKAKEAQFKEINAANEVLSDPEKRAAYDKRLASERLAARTPSLGQAPGVPKPSRAPSSSAFWWTLGGVAVAVPIIWKVATSRGASREQVEIGADGRPLPRRGPDGRFMST